MTRDRFGGGGGHVPLLPPPLGPALLTVVTIKLLSMMLNYHFLNA